MPKGRGFYADNLMIQLKKKFTKKNNCHIVLLGKAGSGKGTFATLLKENLGIPLFSFGELLKKEVRKQTPSGIIFKKHIEQGTFASDYLVMDICLSSFLSLESQNEWIIEGFPRTILQIKLLEKKCPSISKNMKIIYLDLPDEIAEKRILSRLMCPTCFAAYNTISNPSKINNICDICHSELYHREDDNEKTIKTRLQIFKNKSLPVINYYKKSGHLFTIDANQPIENIYSLILETLFK